MSFWKILKKSSKDIHFRPFLTILGSMILNKKARSQDEFSILKFLLRVNSINNMRANLIKQRNWISLKRSRILESILGFHLSTPKIRTKFC